jgi:endo-1,4-beta-mannosidase
MRADGPETDRHSWLNNGYEGVDFVCNLEYADFATIHSYPDAWGMTANGGYKWLGENYFKDRMEVAHSMNKPIILEEYGMQSDYLPTRDILFGYIHDQVNALGYACTLVWAVSHEPSSTYQYGYYGYNDGQGYVFGYTGADTDGVKSIQQQNKYISELSDVAGSAGNSMETPPSTPSHGPFCTDTPPNRKQTCVTQAARGNCNTKWMLEGAYCEYSCGRC